MPEVQVILQQENQNVWEQEAQEAYEQFEQFARPDCRSKEIAALYWDKNGQKQR